MPGSKLVKLFAKSQASAGVASLFDYVTMIALTEFAGVYYVVSTAIGSLVGGIVNFNLNRHWTYRAADGKMTDQALKYLAISATSLLLNTGGVFLLTENSLLKYWQSKLVIAIIVAVGFNFVMHKIFVFKTE